MAYNPSLHTASNKPYATRGKPIDARTYYYDYGNTYRYRPYQNVAQVLAYLPTVDDRRGNFEIVINTGGTLGSDGYITGGVNESYWFKDGYADGNLVRIVADVTVPDLQSVTDEGNTSSNALQLIGADQYDAALNAFSFGYQAGVGFLVVKSLLGTTGIAMTGQGATMSVDGEGVISLFKPSTSAGVAGRVSGRLKVSDGTENDDAATFGQLALKEDKNNKVTSLSSPNNTTYPTSLAVSTALSEVSLGVTNVVPAVDGQNYVDISTLIGKVPKVVFKSGSNTYTISSTPSDANKTVSFNSSNGRITFELPLYDGETVVALFTNN